MSNKFLNKSSSMQLDLDRTTAALRGDIARCFFSGICHDDAKQLRTKTFRNHQIAGPALTPPLEHRIGIYSI